MIMEEEINTICPYCKKPFMPDETITSNENEDIVHLDCELAIENEVAEKVNNEVQIEVEAREVDISIQGDSRKAEITITDMDGDVHHPIVAKNIDAIIVDHSSGKAHIADGVITYRGFCLIVFVKTMRNMRGGSNYLVAHISEKIEEL
jgi:hypothetical protein